MKPWYLIVRLGGIGDNLIVSSVLPLLAETHYVEVMCQEPQHVIFQNNPHIAKLSVRKPGDLPADGKQWQEWFAHRGREYDRWVNLSHSCESMLALLPGQTQFYWPAAWRRRFCGINYLEFVHDIVGVRHTFNPRFYPVEEEVLKASQTLAKVRGAGGYRHVVGIVLSGSRLDKVWPYMPFLVAKLIRDTKVAVVLFGSDEADYGMAKHIQDFVHGYNGSYDGMHAAISPDKSDPSWPIRRSLATLQQCDLVIGPDTGLMWSVAMEPMPKIMLLSHASPENITKHWVNTTTLHADQARVDCWPCHQLHDVTATCRKAENAEAAACISDISHETVLIAAMAALKGEQTNGRDFRVSTSADAELEPELGSSDQAYHLGRGIVPGRAVVSLGFRTRDRLGHHPSSAVDGGGGIACGLVQQHECDDLWTDSLSGDD